MALLACPVVAGIVADVDLLPHGMGNQFNPIRKAIKARGCAREARRRA